MISVLRGRSNRTRGVQTMQLHRTRRPPPIERIGKAIPLHRAHQVTSIGLLPHLREQRREVGNHGEDLVPAPDHPLVWSK